MWQGKAKSEDVCVVMEYNISCMYCMRFVALNRNLTFVLLAVAMVVMVAVVVFGFETKFDGS